MSADQNEKLARRFYESTAPGHREALRGIQASHVVYDLPEGMPAGAGHFEGLEGRARAIPYALYGAFDVHFARKSSSSPRGPSSWSVTSKAGPGRRPCLVRVPFVHIWTVADNHLQRMRGFTDTAVLARALAAS